MPKKYNYNYENVHKGDEFKSFTALFEAVTGEKPPSGSANQEAVKREMSKYIDFVKKSEIDPKASPRAYIVRKVYDVPLELEENRGRKGIYSDYIKPLLLVSCGFETFEGKMSKLSNNLGIFKRYTSYLLDNTGVWKNKSNISRSEFNPWVTGENMVPGQQKYLSTLRNQIYSTIERSLSSLQDEKIVSWKYYHQIIPDILIDIEGSKDRRPKSSNELKEDNKRRHQLLSEIENDKNSVLQPKTLEKLNIYSQGWSGDINYSRHKDFICMEGWPKPQNLPIVASDEQEEAIQNLELFMRQYAYKECLKSNHLPAIEKVLNGYDFFQNQALSQQYKRLVKEMYPWLIECKVIWKEVKYEITGMPEQIDKYIDLQSFDYEKCMGSLSCAFLKYMDSHMDKIKFQPTKESKSDYKGEFDRNIAPQPIDMSKAACALHEKLKSFYSI